jgi:hypothetical protein
VRDQQQPFHLPSFEYCIQRPSTTIGVDTTAESIRRRSAGSVMAPPIVAAHAQSRLISRSALSCER